MRSTTREIQRKSHEGYLMIWIEAQSSRQKHDMWVFRFNESKLDEDQMSVVKKKNMEAYVKWEKVFYLRDECIVHCFWLS